MGNAERPSPTTEEQVIVPNDRPQIPTHPRIRNEHIVPMKSSGEPEDRTLFNPTEPYAPTG